MKYFLLVDWKDDGKFFLHQKLRENDMDVSLIDIPNYNIKDRTIKIRLPFLYFKYLIQAFRTVYLSKSGDDIIVCHNFTTGIAVGLISRLFFRKRKILALNMIVPFYNGFISKIRYFIFHFAMNQPHFYLTVNSSEYIPINTKRFCISEKSFFILHDSIPNKLKYTVDIRNDLYVFSGGEAQRDWNTYFEVAKKLPNLHFVGVARKKLFDSTLTIPSNVDMKFDLDYENFYKLMGRASIIAIPLKSTLPCGLIIIGNAALMNKPVIITKTPSTINYIISNKTGILVEMFNVDNLKAEIEYLCTHKDECLQLGVNLNNYMLKEYSIDKYFDVLKSILKEIQYK